jgi:hypothetical protein
MTLRTLRSLFNWFVRAAGRVQGLSSDAGVFPRSLLVRLPVGLSRWLRPAPHVPVCPGHPAETDEPQANPS